ncbi:MAG: hypothetical protein H6Q74_1592 [Firmicutes bacterium]|nr:hypothetical protein [Bacillota bacterium]
MSPDEVLRQIKNMGINISRSTLLRFEKAKVIPEPKRGANGRGAGRFSDYPEDTPKHFFASWWTIKSEGISLNELSDLLPLGKQLWHKAGQEFKRYAEERGDLSDNEFEEVCQSIFGDDVKAFCSLMEYLERGSNFKPDDLMRAKEKIELYLGSDNKDDAFDNADTYTADTYTAVDVLLMSGNKELDDREVRAGRLFSKWESYYRLAGSHASELLHELEAERKITEYLTAENIKLKNEVKELEGIIAKHNIKPE